MAKALLALQRPEGDEWAGLWGPSLVNWDAHPVGETSGTAFYVAGFAYGIANGLLSVEEYGAVCCTPLACSIDFANLQFAILCLY